MARYGFLYDQTTCVGCNACQMACKDKNNLEKGMFFRRVDTLETEIDGVKTWVHYSGACNHCKDPACMKACPTGAMRFNPDKTVGHSPEKCIGCGTCTWACPYGVPKLSHRKGISMKCNSCLDLRMQGKNPACVDACITHALRFVDLDALTPEELEGTTQSLPILPKPCQTDPSLRIRPKVRPADPSLSMNFAENGGPFNE